MLNTFDEKLHLKFEKDIKYYTRYVDDSFLVGKKQQLNSMLTYLNSLEPWLQYTLEKQSQEGKINFLDLTIQNHNNNLSYKL